MNARGLFHLLVIYLVWGSTYLAIRVAVREGAGFPPFTMAAMRVVVAAPILFLWARGAGHRLRVRSAEAGLLAISGVLLWVGGNGLVVWAEQQADSGYAALLIGSAPLWVALMEAALDRRGPSIRLIMALVTGFAGVGVLSAPALAGGEPADLHATLALCLAPVCWGAGSLLQRRRPVALSPEASSAYQQAFGGAGFVVAALLLREPVPAPIPAAWLAWGYLVVFGSIFAFTSFVKALRLLPISVVMTYAYVNPVVAMVLGWWLLDEPVTGWTMVGAALVVAGVAGVFRAPRPLPGVPDAGHGHSTRTRKRYP